MTTYTVNTGFGSDGLMLEIKQVWVMPEGLKMSVSIHNEAEVPVEFHPDQGSRVVVSGRQLESNHSPLREILVATISQERNEPGKFCFRSLQKHRLTWIRLIECGCIWMTSL